VNIFNTNIIIRALRGRPQGDFHDKMRCDEMRYIVFMSTMSDVKKKKKTLEKKKRIEHLICRNTPKKNLYITKAKNRPIISSIARK
jgi:hypothetical protein